VKSEKSVKGGLRRESKPRPVGAGNQSALRPRQGIRWGLILAVLWLIVAGLAPLVYPTYKHGSAMPRIEAVQSVVGQPGQPGARYPASLEEVRALCQARGVRAAEDTDWYRLTYDPATGRVWYVITNQGLAFREHVTVVVLQRVTEVLVALVLLVVAAGLGQRILTWIRARGLILTERLLFGAALGVGAMALATLGLGLLGLLDFWVFATMLVVFGLVGAKPLVDDWRELYRGWRATTTHMGLWTGLLVAAAILFVSLPLLGAFGPPSDYDALEYHLGAPAEWYVRGSIGRLEGNVYSNFPSNVEMLYLMSMVLREADTLPVVRGMYLGRVLNVLLGVLCGLSLWAFGRRFMMRDGSRAGGIACALFLSCPWFFWILTTMNVFVEVGQTLFSFLAVYAALLYAAGNRPGVDALAAPRMTPPPGTTSAAVSAPPSVQPGAVRHDRGVLVLAALLLGLAMGTKYTVPLLLGVPLVVLVLAAEWRRRAAPAARLGRFVLYGAVAAAVVSPWLIKNAVLNGNPTYPLLYSVFGGRDWSPEQDAKWRYAHSPKFDQKAEQARAAEENPAVAFLTWPLRHAAGFYFTDFAMIAPIVLFVPFAFVERPQRRMALWLAGFLLYSGVVWYLLTNLVDRMLFPVLPLAVALAGWGYVAIKHTAARWLGRLALAGYLIYLGLYGTAGYFSAASQGDVIFERLDSDPLKVLDRALERQNGTPELPLGAFRYVDAHLSKDSNRRILLVGEAESFYLSAFNRSNFIRSTVFDRHPLEGMLRVSKNDNELVERLRERKVQYLLVNYAAIQRFRRTYRYPFEGRWAPGYPPEIDAPLFDRLTAAGRLRRVFPAPDVSPPPGGFGCVIYEIAGT
jgi:hypothetical protein